MMKRFGMFRRLFAITGFVLLLGAPCAWALPYFDHAEIPGDSNAVAYDQYLLDLKEKEAYLWPDAVYTESQIKAVQQNTLRDAWIASNLSYGLQNLPEEDNSCVLAMLNRALLDFTVGNYDAAFQTMLTAKQTMDSMRQKGFTLGKEQTKIFKGEPYEQALAAMYMGLMLYQKGDYQNARAMFAQALERDRETIPDQEDLEDMDADKQALYSVLGNDNRLAYYLLARTFKHLEDDQNVDVSLRNCGNWAQVPEDLQKEACGQFHQTAALLDSKPVGENPYAAREAVDGHNFVVLVQMGHAPKKNISGLEGQKDVLFPRQYPERKAKVFVGGRFVAEAYPMFNLFHQASGAPRTAKDSAQTGKAVGKFAVKLLAAVVSDDLARSIDNAWSVAADTRRWGTPPNEFHIASADLEPGLHDVTVLFYDLAGNPLPHLEQTHYYVPVREGEETFLMVRSLKDRCNTVRDFYGSRITSYDAKENRVVFNPYDLVLEPEEAMPQVKDMDAFTASRLPQGTTLNLFTVEFPTAEQETQFLETGVHRGATAHYNQAQQIIGSLMSWEKDMTIRKVGTARIVELEGRKATAEVLEGALVPEETYFATTYDLPEDEMRQLTNHDVLDQGI